MMTDKEELNELRDENEQQKNIINDQLDMIVAHRTAMIKIEAAINEYWEEMKKIQQDARKREILRKTNRKESVPAMESGVCEMNFSKALKTAPKNHTAAQAVKPLRWRKSGAREISEEIEGVSFSVEKTHYRTQAVPIFSAVLLLDGEAICVVSEDTDANAVKGAVNRWIKNFVRKACAERNDAK